MKNLFEQIKDYVKTRDFLTLKFDYNGSDQDFQGIVLSASSDLVCIALTNDWHFDGLLITKLNCLVAIEHGEIEKFNYQVLNSENQFESFDFEVEWLNVMDWKSACSSLIEKNIFIQVEGLDPAIDKFVFGKPEKAKTTELELLGFDSTGVKEAYCSIPYSEISTLRFLDEYGTILSKYVEQEKIGK